MRTSRHSLRGLRAALAANETNPSELAAECLGRSNGNASHNTYLWQDREWTMAEAKRAEAMPRGNGGPFGDGRPALWGLSVSVKDCFDLAGSPTSAGTRFYLEHNGIVQRDSWLAERLRATGAVITGKTHLHPLAYGITGENPDFGDCLQPGDAGALTGGSSSGAAASVMEGSAIAAIGTDTGGSVRAPAALCGLVGYRASLGRGDWRGGAHLAESFDTMGWLFRDLEDAPLLTGTFFDAEPGSVATPKKVAVIGGCFLDDCDPEIVASMHSAADELRQLGLSATTIDVDWWHDSFEIYAPIQAWEASRIHAGRHDQFGPALRHRFEWGVSIPDDELAGFRRRHHEFRARIDDLLAAHELLLMPASPVSRLAAGADHSQTRPRILRYTTPFSLAGVPVITVPCRLGGMQLAAARGADESLAQLAARLGARRRNAAQLA